MGRCYLIICSLGLTAASGTQCIQHFCIEKKYYFWKFWNNNVAHYDHGKTSGPARKALQGPSIMSTVCQNCQNA